MGTLPISASNRWQNLVYILVSSILSPNFPTLTITLLFPKGCHLPCHTIFSTEHLDPVTHFHLDFSFSIRSPVKKIPPTSPFIMPPPDTSFDIPQYQIIHHSNSSKPSSSSPSIMDILSTYYVLMQEVSFPNQKISCNYVFTTRSFSKLLVAIPHQSTLKWSLPTKPLKIWSASNSSPVVTAMADGVFVTNTSSGSFHP